MYADFVFYGVILFFLRRGPRARREGNFVSHTHSKKYTRLLTSEIELDHTRLKPYTPNTIKGVRITFQQ